MKTRQTALLSALILSFAASSVAVAGPKHRSHPPMDRFDQARVVSSTPVYEEFNEPRRECWTEQVGTRVETVPAPRSYGGAVLGTIVGGIIGNQVGKGNGKTIATAVGAATGAMVGDNMDNRNRDSRTYTEPELVERCRSIDNWTRRIIGYDVVYRYMGQDFNGFMAYDPGASVRVKVNVEIVDR